MTDLDLANPLAGIELTDDRARQLTYVKQVTFGLDTTDRAVI
jgi:hypothetical protein